VKEIFLFCCFTGLRWSDYHTLSEKDFVTIEGKPYIEKQAVKGEAQDYGSFFVPTSLHPFVGEMIEKYGTNNLPKLSNQKINKTLKALQSYPDVDPNSTFEWTHHTARRTFVNWCRNSLHYEAEAVQVFVGHATREMLDDYATVNKNKIIDLFRK
jgi:integrase